MMMRVFQVFTVLFLVSSVFLSSNSYARHDQASSLFNIFKDSCPTSGGTYTSSAIATAQKLSGFLRDLKDDSDCAALSDSFIQANAINAAMNNILLKNSDSGTYLLQQQAILTALAGNTTTTVSNPGTTSTSIILSPGSPAQTSTTTTPASTSTSSVAIANTADLGNLLLQVQASQSLSNYSELAFSAQTALKATHDLVTQAVANQNCLFKKPTLLADIAALVGSVGASVATINPAIGLGVSVGGNLVSDLVNLVVQNKRAKGRRSLILEAI